MACYKSLCVRCFYWKYRPSRNSPARPYSIDAASPDEDPLAPAEKCYLAMFEDKNKTNI